MVVFRKFLIALFVYSSLMALPVQAQRGGDARAAVQSFFNLLKMKKYQELYAFLPREMQQRVTREQLVQMLKRLDDFITIERMEIGRVQQRSIAGNSFAVIDTTLYGQLKRPLQLNGEPVEAGKVIVQQYLFREDGQWKVATADGHTRAQFLKRYPEFSRGFQFTQPQFFLRQNGQWKAFSRK
ncbi:MAG TPA: hypothetical protein VNQ79_13965 [Blastocatellia bacterium]|nr:hypothetical protein [Blastocatellia bacterium]